MSAELNESRRTIHTLNVKLNGARGGQGTSTVAAALALFVAEHARTQLVATDLSATAALLGLPEPVADQITVTDRLTLTGTASAQPEMRIVDAQTRSVVVSDEDLHLVVLRGPCYLALRSLVHRDHPPDGIVLLSEPGRSLTDRDVHDVTGVPVVATVPVTAAVARAIDAGLFIARVHHLRDLASLRRYAVRLLLPGPSHDPVNALWPPAPVAAVDLNGKPHFASVKIGTDLPVALCATGRGSQPRRVRPF